MTGAVRFERMLADGTRAPALLALGRALHREELGGEDSIEFSCAEAPQKYDRLLWRDPEDARWREHVVVRTDEEAGGTCRVFAESSLCDLLGTFIDEVRFTGDAAQDALDAVLAGSGWEGSAEGVGALGSCLLYHANGLAALRRICEVWGAEAEAEITVAPQGPVLRRVAMRPRTGAWRGARLTYGRSMAGCVRTVPEDEVFTALYGFGAGLPVLDGEGAWTGGYTRKLDFSSVNGGVKWVGDERARELWGALAPDGSRRHRFGQVTFSDEDDPARLLERTRAALSGVSEPRVSFTVDAAVVEGRVPVGLGDDVVVTDTGAGGGRRTFTRCAARAREIGADGIVARYTLGSAPVPVYAVVSAAAASASRAEASASGGAAAMAGLATKEYVDRLFGEIPDLSEEEF